MARPDIGFTLEHDGRRSLGCSRATRPARVAALHRPRARRQQRRHRSAMRGRLRLTGVAGLPTFNRGVADHQYLFVNGRPVKDRLLIGAVRGAYAGLLARDRHPVLALFLDLPAEEVDVNVHPAKTEVRFRDPAAVRGLIVGGLRAGARRGRPPQRRARASARCSELADRAASRRMRRSRGPRPVGVFAPRPRAAPACAGVTEKVSTSGTAPQPEAEPATAPVPRYPLGVARGQVAPTYIVAEAEDGLVIVDQHAAHERLVLERMRAACERRTVARARRCCSPRWSSSTSPPATGSRRAPPSSPSWASSSSASGPAAMLVRATPAPLGKADVPRLAAATSPTISPQLGERAGAARAGSTMSPRPWPATARSAPGRIALGRRDERAAARDGGHAAFGPVQPWPPDLGEAGPWPTSRSCSAGAERKRLLHREIFSRYPSF